MSKYRRYGEAKASKMYPKVQSMFEIMADVNIQDHEYTEAARHYLEASKQAKTQHDTIRLFNLSQDALKRSYRIEVLGMDD